MAQKKTTQEEYIRAYKDIAIDEMKKYKIPASITLAQGMLESGSGNSNLAVKANNHFGIKCHGWTGRKFYMDDDEENECFRSYRNPEDSYHDHSLFLTQRSRYEKLFKLNITDYKGWARGLKEAGYATNPRYPELLISLVERFDLTKYDKQALGEKVVEKPLKKQKELPNPSHFEVVDKTNRGRFIFVNNRVKLIIAREGDNIKSLTKELNMYSYQIAKYNDMEKGQEIKAGQVVYLQNKKRKSFEYDYHIVKKGETLRSISQLYGVKLKRLFKLNKMSETSILSIDKKIKLK